MSELFAIKGTESTFDELDLSIRRHSVKVRNDVRVSTRYIVASIDSAVWDYYDATGGRVPPVQHSLHWRMLTKKVQ